MLAALSLVLGVVAEVDQRVMALRGYHDDVAATAAVAARWSASRDEFFAPKGHATVAAVAGLDTNFRFIDEHREQPDSSLQVPPAMNCRQPANLLSPRSGG